MTLKAKKEGKFVTFRTSDLNDYVTSRLRSLVGLLTNGAMALTIVTFLVLLNFFRVPEIYSLALVLVPILGRSYYQQWIAQWVQKQFAELLDL